MFTQTIFPEGYGYEIPKCSKKELMEILNKKMNDGEKVQGRLVYLSTDFSYGIIYFGSDVHGYISGNDIRDFKTEFARCLLNQIINVNLLYFDEAKKQFICSRKELIEEARVMMDIEYKVGYKLICKVLYVNTAQKFLLVDMGDGRTVKIMENELDDKSYHQGDFVEFTIKAMSKSRISKHQIFTLTSEENIGIIIPITFKRKIGEKWYGLVENDNNYPLGEITKLHQKAVYENGDCHVATICGHDFNGNPIYKLV